MRVERARLVGRIHIGGHEGVARDGRGPQVVQSIERHHRCVHLGEALGQPRHLRVVEEVAREAAPALPLTVHAQRKVLAHAQFAPGQIALVARHQRADHPPHGQYAHLLCLGHPAVPAGAGAESVEAGDLIMIGQQAKGVTAERMADHEQRALGVPVLIHRRGQVEMGPVEILHLESAQAIWPGLADATVVQGHGVEATAGGVFGKTAIETLRHPGCAGDQQLRLWSLGVIARGGQLVVVEGEQWQGFAANGCVHAGGDSVRCWRVRWSRVATACFSGSLLPATRACSRPPS